MNETNQRAAIIARLTAVLSVAELEKAIEDGSMLSPFEADILAGIPVLGALWSRVHGHNILVYIAALAVPATAFVLYRTRFGLRLRAVGENPQAVDTAGISVAALRYRALLINGVLCGLAGAYLSTAHGAGFVFASLDGDREENASFVGEHPLRVWPTFFVVDPTSRAIVALYGRERDGQKETNGDVLGHDWLTPYDIRTHRPTPLLLDRFHDPSVVTLARIII